jgi:hypothetical protein
MIFKSKTKAKEKAKRKLNPRVVRSLILIVAIIAVSCGLLVGFSQYRDSQNKKAPERAANEFVNSLEIGSIADAYTQLCASVKRGYSEAQFADAVKQEPVIHSHRITSTDVSKVNGSSSAVVTMAINESSGSQQSLQLVMDDQNGTWMACAKPPY